MEKKWKVLAAGVLLFSIAAVGCAPKEGIVSEEDDPSTVQVVDSTPAPAPEPAPAPAPATMQRINFSFDKSEISNAARAALNQNVSYLRSNPSATVTVEGHCDDVGTIAYNLALGQRRAESVKAFYVRSGIAAARVKTVSYGEERPLVRDNTEEARSQNRRVETAVN
jgi:peptidoglycan-associated lipoprotein